jgi:antitoxin CptB
MTINYGKIAASDVKKRLRFRAWHRGTREADLLIGNFADAVLAGLDDEGLREFETILGCDDADLYDWMTGRSALPFEHDGPVMRLLQEFRLHRADR